jgi:hypothetical protein
MIFLSLLTNFVSNNAAAASARQWRHRPADRR